MPFPAGLFSMSKVFAPFSAADAAAKYPGRSRSYDDDFEIEDVDAIGIRNLGRFAEPARRIRCLIHIFRVLRCRFPLRRTA